MEKSMSPAIEAVVAHNQGPVELSRRMGGVPVYQEIQRWLKRGWASPMHIFKLEVLLPDGITTRDLFIDRERAVRKSAEGAEV